MTASFEVFFIISFLIVIHETGHFLSAKFLGVEVDKIYIYPLGGISKFNMPLNISILKEFIILIFGPIFQVIASIILIIIMPSEKELILIYHYSILFFNLLPIYPLDGGKIVNLLLSLFIPYKTSLKISVYLSYTFLLLIVFSVKKFTINILCMLILSIILITKENKRIVHMYNKFILERYLNKYHFKKCTIVNNLNKFYRNKRHLIKERDNYYLESEYLIKKYQKNDKNR